MSANTKNSDGSADSIPTAAPQIIAPEVGRGHPEYHFVTSISEINKTLGEINFSIKAMDRSIEGLKTKVDDLVKWKNMILGGAIVLGAVCTLSYWLISKASDYVTFKTPLSQTVPAPQGNQPPQQR